MRSNVSLGRVFGIQLGLHYSWFLIALLLMFSFTGTILHRHANWGAAGAAAWAAATTILFFASLLAHELSHSIMALRHGLKVSGITLFALGGISQIEGDMPNAAAEFRIAVVGPLASAVLGALFIGASVLPVAAMPVSIREMFAWVGYINLVLAVFNMLPGYPMDGGRILRALLWWRSHSFERATRTASAMGRIMAVAFMAMGVIDYITRSHLGGLWMVFIGWFLFEASRASYLEVAMKEDLKGVRVGDLMQRDPATIDGRLSVQNFVDNELLRTGHRCYVVREDGEVVGMITPREIRRIERDAWPLIAVDTVMRPLSRMTFVRPDTSLADALRTMGENELVEVPVIVDGRLEGVLSRADVLAYLQTRSELRAS